MAPTGLRRFGQVSAVFLLSVSLLTQPVISQSQDRQPAPPDPEAVLGVIGWNNTALPAAYWNWDLSGLEEYLVGPELEARRLDIARVIEAGAEVWAEQVSFEVTSVTFPEPDRAVVETIEGWYEWISRGEAAVEREWTVPERYELWLVDGRWYIAAVELLGELPPFAAVEAQVEEPLVTEEAPPPAEVAPPPATEPPPARTCCRVCTTGKACGNTCIARNRNCNVGPGCACNAGVSGGILALIDFPAQGVDQSVLALDGYGTVENTEALDCDDGSLVANAGPLELQPAFA